VTHYLVQCLAIVKAIMKLPDKQKARNFLTCLPLAYEEGICSHGVSELVVKCTTK
jgi:hypothetical protein